MTVEELIDKLEAKAGEAAQRSQDEADFCMTGCGECRSCLLAEKHDTERSRLETLAYEVREAIGEVT